MPAAKKITREMILKAAFELLRERGMESVNIKSLAGSLGCSTQPVYLSFSGMDELRQCLVEEAERFFVSEMGLERVDADIFGMNYIRFAQNEPHVFGLLFMSERAFDTTKAWLVPITERSIGRIMGKYGISHDEAHCFHDQLWIHAHGIAATIWSKYCTWNMDKVERMLGDCERLLSAKYGAAK